MPGKIGWHRLFGLTLQDLFSGSAYHVEVEQDLSVKQQLLDVLIIEMKEGPKPARLPDGLEALRPHNLLTYKSMRQSMDAWALDELIGHYVSYRKKVSLSASDLIPEDAFQLFAVSTRYPRKLMDDGAFEEIGEGVFDRNWGSRTIRLIVLSRIPKKPENAAWHLFSARPETVVFGAEQYRWRISETSSIINDLFQKYNIEGVVMPYTKEDYLRDHLLENIHKFSQEDLANALKMKLTGKKREEFERLFGDMLKKKPRTEH